MGGKESKQPKIEEQLTDTFMKPKLRLKRNTDFGRFLDERRLSDMEKYRAGYPGKEDNLSLNSNYLFYTNKIKSRPDGCYIDKIHQSWWGDYDKLESRHGYIQWLFPVRESGLNWEAQELQLHEAQRIREDPEAVARVIRSYRMMLDFYGIEMVDEKSGEVRRTPDWRVRFHHLNKNNHNFLRITRILKCLGELSLEHYKVPLIQFFLNECLLCGTLPNIYDSCTTYWIDTVKDPSQREQLIHFVNDNIDLCEGPT